MIRAGRFCICCLALIQQWESREQMLPGMCMRVFCGSVQTVPSLRYVILVAEAAASNGAWQQPQFPASLIRDACFSLPAAVCLAATSIQATGGLSFIQASFFVSFDIVNRPLLQILHF